MNNRSFLRIAAAFFLCATLSSAQVPSATPAPPGAATANPTSDLIKLDQIVVTGSATPAPKLETAVALTTLDPLQIQIYAPRSTSDLLKLIPGFFTESGGGEAGDNLTTRGAVQTSSGPNGYFFVALQEDGLPIWSESQWRFTQADDFYRASDFVSNIEAVRGGPAGIFASSDPLGIVNMISRDGSDRVHGEYKIETSDFGEIRNEGYLTGPISNSTTYAIGGFYRIDNGIRNPGFTADKGGQLMANVKYAFPDDKGHLKLSAKLFDDHPLFLGEMPYTNNVLQGTIHPSTIPGGPDLETGAYGPSPDTRFFSFPGTPAGQLSYDLANGYGASYYYIGSDIEYHLTEGLNLKVLNRWSKGSHDTNSLSSGTGVTYNSAGIATSATLTSLQNIADAYAVKSNANGAFAAALQPNGHYDFMLTYPGFANGTTGSVAAANPAAAAALDGNGLGSVAGWGYDLVKISDYQEDMRLTQTWNDGKTALTGGFYYSYFTVATFGETSQELLGVSPRPMRLDLTYLSAATGAPIGQYTYHGITQLSSTYLNNYADKRTADYFADFTHKIGALSLDAGVRYMTDTLYGSAEQAITQGSGFTSGYNGNLAIGGGVASNSGLGYYPALQESIFGNGSFDSGSSSSSGYSDTAGANYVFPDHHTALFFRHSRGIKMNYTNDLLQSIPNGNNATSGVTPFNRNDGVITTDEGGIKYGNNSIGIFLTAFDERLRNIAANATLAGTVQSSSLNENVTGLEAEIVWAPYLLPGLSLSLNGTVQSPKYIAGSFATTEANPVTGTTLTVSDLTGLGPDRIPKEYGTVSASYIFSRIPWGALALNASYQYTGRNPLDTLDFLYAAPFHEFAAGVSLTTKFGVTFRLNAANLFNSDGITEGNPIGTLNASNVSSLTYFTFRPVEPRSVVGSVAYQF